MNATRVISRTSSLWIAGLAMLCVGAGIPHAHAGSPAAPLKSIKVKYGDLNLQNPAGIETLYRRIGRAARQVCDADTTLVYPGEFRQLRECVETAMAKAVNDVNNKNLTAMFRAKNKTGSPS